MISALIYAAGKGERLRPITSTLAKPAVPFLNVPLIGYPLFYLEQARIQSVAINTFHLPDTVVAISEKLAHRKTKIYFSHETEIIKESGGGLAQAVQNTPIGQSEAVILANGDASCIFESTQIIAELIQHFRRTQAVATLVVCDFPKKQNNFGGVYANSEGRIQKFSKTEVVDPHLMAHHYTGYMIVSAKVWRDLKIEPSNLLYDRLQQLILQGEIVNILKVQNQAWYETGNPKDFLFSTEQALHLLAEPSLTQKTLIQILERFTPSWWKGWKREQRLLTSLPSPDRLTVEGFAVMGPEAQYGSFIRAERSVVMGTSLIYDSAYLKNKIYFNEEIKGPA